MRTLAVDIGNTRVKAAVFDDDRILEVMDSGTGDINPVLVDAIERYGVSNGIVASTSAIETLVGLDTIKWISLDHSIPLPIRLNYNTPETLGRDRIAAVVAANFLFKGENVLVIDTGTCVTYDLLTAEGEFQGGNIAPGLDMRLRSMHDYTARLPLADRSEEKSLLGSTTSSALQLGAQNGIVLEIEGYIRRLRTELGSLSVVLTGGDSAYFVERLKTKIFVRPNLVLVGLNEILRYNVA